MNAVRDQVVDVCFRSHQLRRCKSQILTTRAALVSILLLTSSALCAAEFTGRVTAVPDGDTITVRTAEGQKHRVRLDGIDAPERTQPYSQLSRKNLIAVIGEQPVTVVSDKVDRHGRMVGVVRNAAGRDIGLEQIKAGLAWHFKKYEHEQSADNRAAYAAVEANRASRQAWLVARSRPNAALGVPSECAAGRCSLILQLLS
jgi:endonuclease YncB( thermonuclease family)